MSENYFVLLKHVFKLMDENKLRKDIDDTLLEKLLTSIKKHLKNDGFIDELYKKTGALTLIEKVLSSFSRKKSFYPLLVKCFIIKLLGLLYMGIEHFPLLRSELLPFYKYTHKNYYSDHLPSLQDALLECLSGIVKQYFGALWFVQFDLEIFLSGMFYSKSYYVRKSAVNILVDFISQWTHYRILNERGLAENHFEKYINDVIFNIINQINDTRNPEEILQAKCCISVIEQLLVKGVEFPLDEEINLEKTLSRWFMNLPEDTEFINKLIDLYLDLHLKFALSTKVHYDVIKCLFHKENVNIVVDLTSSFMSIMKSEQYGSDGLKLYLMPLHSLIGTLYCTDCKTVFTYETSEIQKLLKKKMEDKEQCKILITSSLSALKKIASHMDSENQKRLGLEVLQFVKNSDDNSSYVSQHHKWLYSLMKNMSIHQSFIDLFSSLLSEEVHRALKYEGSDLLFLSILEFLKKSNSQPNFTHQLLQLMKKVLILHEKYQFDLKESEKKEISEILCRKLNDCKESVVDSALILAGWMITSKAWQEIISTSRIHLLIWDIAVQGSSDGAIRSTALKVLIEGCLDSWCLNELKSLKNVMEADIVKILFDMTQDSDFYLQREALSCLSIWMKSKWNDVLPSAKDQFFSALVSAVKSLDLELKLTALDVWSWLLENKFTFLAISPSFEVKDYVGFLANCGFGLSMVLAFEDYDSSVQFKAAGILNAVKNVLISKGNSFESLVVVPSNANTSQKSDTGEYISELTSKEEKEEGIENVMEISTAEQIAKICHPGEFSVMYGHRPLQTVNRECSLSSFWISVWSDKIETILNSSDVTNDALNDESLLNDIISAAIFEYDSVEDTPDCY